MKFWKKNFEPKSIWDNSKDQYQKGDFKIYWELLPEVSRYQNRSMSGDPDVYGLTCAINYIRENINNNNLRGLSIGCNVGAPEISFFQTGLFNRIEVVDIAEGLLNKQRMIAVAKGLSDIAYIKQDCNNLMLKENTYDLIWSVGSIHHIRNLELLFEEINKGLKDNGIFVLRDYIGRNRLQFTDLQLSIVNEILSILPIKYKKTHNGLVKEIVRSIDSEELMAMDPSESV